MKRALVSFSSFRSLRSLRAHPLLLLSLLSPFLWATLTLTLTLCSLRASLCLSTPITRFFLFHLVSTTTTTTTLRISAAPAAASLPHFFNHNPSRVGFRFLFSSLSWSWTASQCVLPLFTAGCLSHTLRFSLSAHAHTSCTFLGQMSLASQSARATQSAHFHLSFTENTRHCPARQRRAKH